MTETHQNDESQECAQMRRQFDLYELDLPLDKSAGGFETHFKTCANCRNWLASWDLVKVAAHKFDEVEVPPLVLDNIMAAVTTLAAPATPAIVSIPVTDKITVGPEKMFTSDLATMLFGFGILVLSFTVFASGSFDESLSWCLSFVLLIAFNQVTKPKAFWELHDA